MDLQTLQNKLLELGDVVGIRGTVDIALMSLMVYVGLTWARRSRVSNVIRGALVLGAIYLGARQFDLGMTAAVLEAFFGVLLVAAVVIFRDELRTLVERVASLSRRPSGLMGKSPPAAKRPDGLIDMLVRTLGDLASAHIGALVVLRGDDPLDAYLQGGAVLDGKASEPLLKSIFDTHSIGHDGAAIIAQGQVERFAVHLPLSTNFELLGHRGTRHAAALGLSEQTDALCLAVSEERGKVTAMSGGALEPLDDDADLRAALERHLGTGRDKPSRSVWSYLRGNWSTKLAALAIAGLLWVVLVHGAGPSQRTFTLPVEVVDLQTGREVTNVVPREVAVTFSGARRDYYLMSRASLRVVLSLPRAPLGTSSVAITAPHVSHPQSLTVQRILPGHVAVVLRRRAAPEGNPPKP